VVDSHHLERDAADKVRSFGSRDTMKAACENIEQSSASLRFIPGDREEAGGYGFYLGQMEIVE
jgi:hypothetical protein